MPRIRNRFQFEPDSHARSLWLGTRKESFICGSVYFPGLFQTVGFINDLYWVVVALLIEISAVYVVLQAGLSNGEYHLIMSIISVFLFIILDISGVRNIHARVGEVQRLSNLILVADNNIAPGIQEQIKKLKRSYRRIFGVLALILSSLIKIISVILLTVYDDIYYLLFASIYILLIYIHYKHTGFWFAEVLTRKYFDSNYREFTNDLTTKISISGTQNQNNGIDSNSESENNSGLDQQIIVGGHRYVFVRSFLRDGNTILEYSLEEIRHQARTLYTIFEDEIELNQPIVAGKHKIVLTRSYNKGESTVHEYLLETTGILEDQDILLLAQNQNTNNQKTLIGKKCLEHQLTIILPNTRYSL